MSQNEKGKASAELEGVKGWHMFRVFISRVSGPYLDTQTYENQTYRHPKILFRNSKKCQFLANISNFHFNVSAWTLSEGMIHFMDKEIYAYAYNEKVLWPPKMFMMPHFGHLLQNPGYVSTCKLQAVICRDCIHLFFEFLLQFLIEIICPIIYQMKKNFIRQLVLSNFTLLVDHSDK